MEHILDGLNTAQRDAVICPASVLQVLAPPGSGKTKTLTARVAYLVAQNRLKPWNIIVCTFTVKAANEMKDRIKNFVGEDVAKQLKLGTFHSIALRYLKQYGQHIGLDKDFGIADTADSKAILKRVIKQGHFGMEPGAALGRISSQKSKGISSDQFLQTAKTPDQRDFARLYQDYQAVLQASNLLDYDDLLLRCCFLLRSHPLCVSNVEAVLIDEFQDTNSIQYELMGLFAQEKNAITIVGDPDQSIYGFRSAEIKNLSRMTLQWPDTLTINLEKNYRSSGAILHVAQKIIEQDESRPQKKLRATHSHGLRPVLRRLPSAADEAEWIVSEVKRMQALTGRLLQANDFAILLRSAFLSRVLESALGKAGVPYHMVGGVRFYDRAEVKVLIDYLRIISQPGNNEAMERIINVPGRRIGPATIQGLREEALSHDVSLWELVLSIVQGRRQSHFAVNKPTQNGLALFVNIILSIRRQLEGPESERPSFLDLLNLLIKKLDFQRYIALKYPDDKEARWTNVEELIAQAVDVSDPEKLQAALDEDSLPDIEGLEQRPVSGIEGTLSLFLANVALVASPEQKAGKDAQAAQCLTISTIHAAKGLEWPVVFIPACYHGSIPHSRADDADEERRLLYVGMTRAQALLYLSYPKTNTQREYTAISTFLEQPGVPSFFEEHGPSIVPVSVEGLARTLGRKCPSAATIDKSKRNLEGDEDNYWPLNGEEPRGGGMRLKYNGSETSHTGFGASRAATTNHPDDISTASGTGKFGFVSVAAEYEQLMEQSRLSKVDRRMEKNKKAGDHKPRGRKKQIEGRAAISDFLPQSSVKSQETDSLATREVPSLKRPAPFLSSETSKKPLREIQNRSDKSSLEQHKPRTAPFSNRSTIPGSAKDSATSNDYIFISSSPPRAESDENQISNVGAAGDANLEETATSTKVKPASTFHTTSMQTAAAKGKTLGMRRSLKGWSTRGRRR